MSYRAVGCVQRLRLSAPQRLCRSTASLWRTQRTAALWRAVSPAATCSTRPGHGNAPPAVPSLPSTESVDTDPTTAGTSIRDRFVCPECGKRFLCAANLLQHRTARHGFHVATPQENARATLIAENEDLQDELTRLRARVKQLKGDKAAFSKGGSSSSSSSSNDNNASGSAEDVRGGVSKPYTSAVPTGQLVEVDAAVEAEWRRSGHAIGTGISFVDCVGTVVGPAQVGTLAGASAASPGVAPRVLQFRLEAHGYRERRPGQLTMYRDEMVVRYIPAQPYHGTRTQSDGAGALFSVREGDVVRVQGHYALHNTYDMVSKQPVENVVVEADLVGLLRRVGTAAAVVPPKEVDDAAVSEMCEDAAIMCGSEGAVATSSGGVGALPRRKRNVGKKKRTVT